MTRSIGASVVVAVVMVAFLMFRDTLWEWLVGPFDASPVSSFETLTPKTSPNRILVCPPGLCAVEPDMLAPVFGVPVETLAARLAAVVAEEPRIAQVGDFAEGRVRFIQRSAVFRFPDLIDVHILPFEPGGSTLAIYSRSLVGYADFGVNRARVKRWLGALSAMTPLRPPG